MDSFGPILPSLLAFLRLTGFFVSSPFPGQLAPPRGRLIVSAALAFGFAQSIPMQQPQVLWAAVIGEVTFGLSMGFLLSLPLHAFSYAGELTSQQMGLRMPSAINPFQYQLSLLGGAMSMIMLGMFVVGGGPARLVLFLFRMFELVPAGSISGFSAHLDIIVISGAELFSGAINVAAPLITGIFAAQILLAVLARSVPTLNLFIEGPAFTTSAGIIALTASLNTFAPLADRMFLIRMEEIARWFSG